MPTSAEEQTLPKRTRDKLAHMGAAFNRIDRALFGLGLQGLQRMTQSSSTELQALQQTAHNAALISIERQIDVLSTHVQRYLDRDPLFTMPAYLSTLNRIWLLNNKARQLHAAGKLPEEMVEVIGEARRSYELADKPLLLQPLGASGWVTDTDFVGITIYFYVDGSSAIYQASTCKPTMYFGNDPRQLMRTPVSDYVDHSIYDMAHGAFEFNKAKVSRDGRLSLHRDLRVRKAPYIGGRAYEALAARDWTALLRRLREGQLHPVQGLAATEVFIEPASFGKLLIDDKNARAVAPIVDQRGAQMTLEVSLREENNFLVDNLEYLLGAKGRRLLPNALFGRAWIADGQLKFFPYTSIYNQAIVLSDHGQQRVNEVHLSLESLQKVKEG